MAYGAFLIVGENILDGFLYFRGKDFFMFGFLD